MHRNFFLFKRQISELESNILNNRLINCFTHRKDELVLHLKNEREYFLRISVNKKLPYLLLYNPQNVKSHHIHFFEQLNEHKISSISITPFDKLIHIRCGDFILNCTFYGHAPNIVLKDKGGHCVDRFKKITEQSELTSSSENINPYSTSAEQITEMINRNRDVTLEQFIKRFVKGFNTVLARELAFRSSLAADSSLTSLKNSSVDEIYSNLEHMVTEMQQGSALIYEQHDLPYHLSIVQLNHLKGSYVVKTFSSVNEAWKYFINYHQITQKFDQMKLRSQNALKRRVGFLRNTLRNIQQSEDIEKKKKLAELKGNLLLTFTHQIQKGSSEVFLQNIFSNSPQNISIKLDPTKSVTANAQVYFNKFKDVDRTKEQMRIRKRTYKRELIEYEELTDRLTNTSSIKELLKIHHKLIDKGIIQRPAGQNEASRLNIESFKHALLDKDWEVLVGRNAGNNDLLTFKFAGKFDFWFHAQGVSGSHVILRRQNKNQQPSNKLLVQAAQIAAYFSAAKNNSTVPVIYTEVRYVRKPRKAAPGLVTTTNTQTIFVTPKNLI